MSRGPERLRLGLIGLLLVAWSLDWTTAQTAAGAALERGPGQTGALGGAVLLALWGLGATALLARTPRGRERGATLTDALLAGAATFGLVWAPGWLGSGARWAPVFLALLLLSLLDLFAARRRGRQSSREVSLIRGAAAAVAGAILLLDARWLLAGLALWMAASALLCGTTSRRGDATRWVEGLLLGTALAAGLTPWLGPLIASEPVEQQGAYAGQFLWTVTSVALVLLTLGRALGPRRPETV